MLQPGLKPKFIIVLLVFCGHEMVSQHAISSIYQKLQLNQPELFKVYSNPLNEALKEKDWMEESSFTEEFVEIDPYKRSRRFFNLSVAASSIYQGVVMSKGMSVKKTMGTPPLTHESIERTPVGMAFPFLFAGGMSFGSYLINYRKPIQPGQGNMYLYGSFMGLVHGSMLTRAFGNTISDDYYKHSAYIGGIASLAEGFWLTHFARKNQLTLIETTVAINSSFYGGLFGALIGDLISKKENLDRGISLGLTAGSIGGVYFSKYLIRNRFFTSGDLIVINSAATTGFLVGQTINWFSNDRITGSLGYFTIIGSALVGSYILTDRHTFSESDGLKIIGGACLGLFCGVPVTVIMNSNETHNAIFPMVSGAILGWLGSAYLIMKKSHKNNHIIYRNKKKKHQIRYNFNPAGMVFNFQNKDNQLKMMQSGISADLIQLQYRF